MSLTGGWCLSSQTGWFFPAGFLLAGTELLTRCPVFFTLVTPRGVGVTRQTVIAIEQGRYSPSLEMAFQIAHVLGVSLEDVFQYPQPEGDQP
jgi:hypothetical protein